MNKFSLVIRQCILLLTYSLCAFTFYDLHGMRQWPAILLMLGIAVLMVTYAKNLPWLANAACGGYLIAFGIGYLLQTNGTDPGGGATNNLWQIWSAAYAALLFLGGMIDLITRKKRGA